MSTPLWVLSGVVGLLWLGVVLALAIALGARASAQQAREAMDPERFSAALRARFEEAIAAVESIRAQVAAMAESAAQDREASLKRLARLGRQEQAAQVREQRQQQQQPQNGAAQIDWSQLLVK